LKKGVIAILLALIMVMSIASPAFAVDPVGTTTTTKLKKGTEVKVGTGAIVVEEETAPTAETLYSTLNLTDLFKKAQELHQEAKVKQDEVVTQATKIKADLEAKISKYSKYASQAKLIKALNSSLDVIKESNETLNEVKTAMTEVMTATQQAQAVKEAKVAAEKAGKQPSTEWVSYRQYLYDQINLYMEQTTKLAEVADNLAALSN